MTNPTPAARSVTASPLIVQEKLSVDPSVPFDQIQVQSVFPAGSPVGISVNYVNTHVGDRIDARIYSTGNEVSACNAFSISQAPSGNYWCRFGSVNPGVYEIRVSINDTRIATYNFTVGSPQTVQSPQNGGDAVSSARSTVENYWSTWSSAGDGTGEAVRLLYAAQVTFYGKRVALGELMRDKADFAKRWPVRTYTPVQNSMMVTCHSNGFCDATGLVDWLCKDFTGARRSKGTAKFSFTLENGLITAESGAVVSRNFSR